MKKLFIIPMALISTAAFAQKPEAGKITNEVGFSMNGWSQNVSSFGLNGRYFLSPGLAVALGVSLSTGSNSNEYAEKADGTGATGTYDTKSGSRTISLGIQKHFAGTEKLSPWVGLGLGIGGGSSSISSKEAYNGGYQKNYSIEEDYKYSSLSFNINLGIDYWFTDGMFIGLQYSPVGWYSETGGDRTRTVVNNSITTKTVTLGSKYSSISTLSAIPTFRLGWRF